jgi:hypothetical protein
VKFVDHWEEEDGDATILHDRERFSHELTLIFSDGKTRVPTHEKPMTHEERATSQETIAHERRGAG